jgi:Raf kinase inhibitor-like YbhB/YbcL family protein
MHRLLLSILSVILVTAAPVLAQQDGGFTLTSADIKNGTFTPAHVFNGFGCTGKNVSPALTWKGAPSGTRSFVLTVYDPDAPTGSGFWHWVVMNIPPSTTSIPSGVSRTPKMPGVEMRTDFGTAGYGGPCPPAGNAPHRYIFTVYALKVDKLDLDPQATAAMVGFMTRANSLGLATFTARYGR